MASPLHEGEIALQERSGARDIGAAVGRAIRDHMPSAAQEFLQQLPFVVLGAADENGDVWATHLVGEPGLVRPQGDRTVIVDGGILPDDPLAATLGEVGRPVGMLGIELSSRRRMRLNGRIESVDAGAFTISTTEVYANCPKYIQAHNFAWNADRERGEVRRSTWLDDCQRGWLGAVDTCSIATVHAERGADCSHRGGMPGFVQVHSDHQLSFPDYVGNFMFQTLGNIDLDPRSGLVFADYESGTLLHVTGDTRVDWSDGRRAEFEAAERIVDFEMKCVIERPGVVPLTAVFVDYSKFRPRPRGSRDASERYRKLASLHRRLLVRAERVTRGRR